MSNRGNQQRAATSNRSITASAAPQQERSSATMGITSTAVGYLNRTATANAKRSEQRATPGGRGEPKLSDRPEESTTSTRNSERVDNNEVPRSDYPAASERVAAAAERSPRRDARRLRALGSVAASLVPGRRWPPRRDGHPARGPLRRRSGGAADRARGGRGGGAARRRRARPRHALTRPAHPPPGPPQRVADAFEPRAEGLRAAARAVGGGHRAPGGQAQARRLLRTRHPPASPGQGVRVPRRGRSPRGRAHRGGPHPRAGHSAGLGGRLDLPLSDGAHPGHGHRCARPQAVPLPRPLARAPRPREVRVDGALRPRAAGPARARERGPGLEGMPASGRWPAPRGCSTVASSASARRTTPRRTTPTGSPRWASAT